jgi:hypothetical protein
MAKKEMIFETERGGMKRFKLSQLITVNGHYFCEWGQQKKGAETISLKSKESMEALGDNLDVFDCSGWRKLAVSCSPLIGTVAEACVNWKVP